MSCGVYLFAVKVMLSLKTYEARGQSVAKSDLSRALLASLVVSNPTNFPDFSTTTTISNLECSKASKADAKLSVSGKLSLFLG